MPEKQIAEDVVVALGGSDNVIASAVCMTRLRITLKDASLVSNESLASIPGVLGSVARGPRGVEVVFGPSVVENVYAQFKDIIGSRREEPAMPERPKGAMRVVISPGKRHSYDAQAQAHTRTTAGADGSDDLQALMGMLDDSGPASAPAASVEKTAEPARRVLIINGPNINMVGIREPGIYGKQTYEDIVSICKAAAAANGFDECTCYQSNHEGDLVDQIQAAWNVYDGIVINPAAYTHTSVAILDALKAVSIPAVEVHISKVEDREDFRQISYVRQACFRTITGMGIAGYRLAIEDLANHLGFGTRR